MKVGLLTDSIERGSPGLRRYAMRLSAELLALGGADITLLHFSPGRDSFFEGKPHRRLFDTRVPLAGKQLVFYPQVRPLSLDIVHDTYHFPPFLAPASYGRIMTVADTTAITMRTHRLKNRLAHKLLFPVLVRRADHILTISQHTRHDLIELLRLPEGKVTATPLAADDHLQRVSDPARLADVRYRLKLPARYFLYVGTIEPRKNLERTVKAFARAAAAHPDAELLLAGPRGWGDADLEAVAAAEGVGARVRLLGRVEEQDLAALYTMATALVYPSLYEGFGLPPLEAMQCGCPVITSNVSSLPEVVGDAALLVDPRSIDGIAEAMRAVLASESERGAMIERGLKRARLFSWRRCAERTMEVYEHVAASRAASRAA
ncbi:MAG TPA: glycosyltransferase family 1 protein [Dehalococcoidia bacterium]|nr:glycosyltransferase family 1 protein [Dehalococcoidia bacterium]